MSPASRRASPRALALATLALLVLATFADALRPSRALYDRDVHSYFYPQRSALQSAVSAGELPLWNPWVGFGAPLLADASAELAYPATWLLLPLPVPLQFELFASAHCLLAALGAAALARRLLGSELGAGVAGAAYALAGPLLSAVGLYHHFAGAAFLPWVLWALEGLLRRPERGQALVLGVLAALQILAGSGDLVLMTGLACLGRLLLELRRRGPAELAARAVPLALATALALALGAVQWLPTVERGLHGLRAAQDLRTRAYWSLHPESLIDLAVPRLVSDAPLSTADRERLFEGREPLFACLYVGVVTLALGALGLLLDPGRAWPLAGGAAVFLLLGLGRHTPAYALLLQLPGFSLLRYPQKYLLAGALCLALLAAAGAVALLREWSSGDARRARVLGLGLVALALLLTIAAVRRDGSQGEAVAALKLGRSALLLALAALLLFRRARAVAPGRAVVAALLGLGALDLVVVGRGTNPTAPAELYTHRPPVLDYVGDEPGRLYAASSPGCLAPGEARAGFEPSAVAALGFLDTLRPPSGIRFGLRGSYDGEFTGLGPRWAAPYTALVAARLDSPAALRLLQLGGVRDVLFLGSQPPASLEPVAALPTPYVCALQLLRVPDPQPPAYVVARERPAEGDALPALLDPGFDPRAEVLLAEAVTAGAASAAAAPAKLSTGGSSARVVARTADSLEVAAQLDAPGVLVVTEAFDEGWLAEIDGRPAPVVRANGLFRAVRVEAGRHEVRFRYRPPAVVAGTAVSAGGLLVLGWLAAGQRRRSRIER
jgi:hypothetical protein